MARLAEMKGGRLVQALLIPRCPTAMRASFLRTSSAIVLDSEILPTRRRPPSGTGLHKEEVERMMKLGAYA